MKKSLRIAFLAIFLICGLKSSEAQDCFVSNNSQFSLGIENTRLVYGEYTYKNQFIARLNVSVYSEKLAYQYIRGSVGYKTSLGALNLKGLYFFGSTFNGSYYNTGVKIAGDAVVANRLLIDATLAPWYDSGYKYTTCWEAKIGCKITNHIDIKVGYTTIPEYRRSENRVIGCFDFHVSNLYVSPYITAGVKSSEGSKGIRVGFGFGYQF